jgi:hypothetical protein
VSSVAADLTKPAHSLEPTLLELAQKRRCSLGVREAPAAVSCLFQMSSVASQPVRQGECETCHGREGS